LQKKQPHTLVIWGKYDPSFQVAEAAAYKRDLPAAGLHIIDAGHFAPGSGAEQIADSIRSFLK
jgi:pimeloyl-ACP methyl ester carboxylesterase